MRASSLTLTDSLFHILPSTPSQRYSAGRSHTPPCGLYCWSATRRTALSGKRVGSRVKAQYEWGWRGQGRDAGLLGLPASRGGGMGAVIRLREQRADPGGQGLGKRPGEGGKQKAPCPRRQSEWQWAGRVPGVTRGTVLPAGRGGPAPSRTLLGGTGCTESRKRATKEGDRVLQPDPCPCPEQRLTACGADMGTWWAGRGVLSQVLAPSLRVNHTLSVSVSPLVKNGTHCWTNAKSRGHRKPWIKLTAVSVTTTRYTWPSGNQPQQWRDTRRGETAGTQR